MNLRKPLLIFDGDCHFCRLWIERWRESTGDKVEYASSQTVGADHPEITPEELATSVQWIGPDGGRASGAKAALSALAYGGWVGRLLWRAYGDEPAFAALCEFVYRGVAAQRQIFSLMTRLLWGNDVRRPTYAVSHRLFLHLLGLIYFVAFLSFWLQAPGLIGKQGILPAAEYFHRAGEVLGSGGFWQLPSFCWWGASDAALSGWCIAGMAAALLLAAGVLPGPCLLFLWADYLSLSVAGQVFYEFQWDSLLLEAGFLAVFLAPWTLRIKSWPSAPRAAHFLLIWLLFRLMFSAGVVKLSSGDPTWAHGLALNYHFFTQPLPTPLAWFARQLPGWWQKLSVLIMFLIELGLPCLLFFPRRLRLIGAGGIAFFQILIAATGNYGFFNFLSLALCLLVVDDAVWRKILRRPLPPSSSRFFPRIAVTIAAVLIFFLTLPPFASIFPRAMPDWLAQSYDLIAPFRTISRYGLFAVMTTERREITIQGSDDGLHWKDYVFPYKPGPLKRPPPWVAPYMPRLDWQMWFAALGQMEDNPWFGNLLVRLMQGSPPVLALLEENPFPQAPPRYVRAMSDSYTFTTPAERRQTGGWWKSVPAAIYCPEVSLAPKP